MPHPDRISLHVQLPRDLMVRVTRVAEEEDRTVTAVMIRALRTYVATAEDKQEEDAA